ncbi:NADP-dependent oxidoreductase [Burkholderia plantarii]|uniref:Alcohol dehydrogenase, zinc-binding protein n=1 Tax=Burkholderia plantarii TaxID=41899 RepID=A0A0B6S8P7_BURPL|nr:NADP-dependent oxidoreductase [Burkholderia plantarii]AJK49660.1 alcohol dehydrogenase, zinc-binding protein [Burkholderia plantarii]
MNSNRALVLNGYGDASNTRLDTVAKPAPAPGEVLVRVAAAGINGLDWKIREGYVRDAFPLALPTVLGIELAGVVEAVGAGVTRFARGDRVAGGLGRVGAYADYVAVDAAKLARVPDGFDEVQAAALPVAAMSAWQSLHAAGPLAPGARVLIHGAAGGLGGFAVQFAKQAGAFVIATVRGRYADEVRALGADQVIDYETQRFEAEVADVDLVLDYVGGEALERSWQVLAPGGCVVGTTSPEIVARTPAGRRGLWFMVTPDAERLERIIADVAQGRLVSRVTEVVAPDQLAEAIERHRVSAHRGKSVVDFRR